MDLHRIIQELIDERDRIESLIKSLELVSAHRTASVPKRRGRKSMDQKAREEVSGRMRRYWARKRAERAAAVLGKESGSENKPTSAQNDGAYMADAVAANTALNGSTTGLGLRTATSA